MPAPCSFDYAVLRVVPRVDRGEQMNVGVILYCRAHDYLAARVALDRDRLAAFAPGIDLAAVEGALATFPRLCDGDPAAGPIARLPQAERFHWLVAPRSTVTQTSAVHSGLCTDPAATLAHLVGKLVTSPAA